MSRNADDFDPGVLGGSVKRGIVNPDLLEERAKCNFDQREMANYLFKADLVLQVEKINNWIVKHPALKSDVNYYEMSRDERFKVWYRRYRYIMEDEEMSKVFTNNSNRENQHFSWAYMFPGDSPLTLHQTMFTDSLKTFGSEEQRAHYLPQADNLNIIGCYAQTELGHGSNVAGLETTATYDEKTETFDIHSPTIKAAKFWPGALGL